MFWTSELTFPITPKSGPLRGIGTLLDASRALTRDLPSGYLKRPHWRDAGWAVMKAADSGQADDIKAATELIVRAYEREGWLQRSPAELGLVRLHGLLRAIEQPLRGCMADEDPRARLTLIRGARGKSSIAPSGPEQRTVAA
jgi:hypothetical protein